MSQIAVGFNTGLVLLFTGVFYEGGIKGKPTVPYVST